MKKNNISTLPKKTNTHYIENIYKLSLDYKGLSLADVNLDDVSKFNDLVGKFSLLGTGTFDGNKNTETLKKFIIYISTYINTERYCEDIIKYIDKIDVDFEKKYIDNILAKKFDKDVLEDFIKIVKFIKGKKEHFKNNQNKFVAEDAQKVEDIFIKDSTAQKSFMKYLGNPKKAAMALLLVAPFISQALGDISTHNLYISETQQNISQTMSLLDKDFENQSYKIKIIYEKLAKFGVYETEELKNIQILQSKISEINLQKIETQAQIDFIKNDANFIDYIKETLSQDDAHDPLQILEYHTLDLDSQIVNFNNQIMLNEAAIQEKKTIFSLNTSIFANGVIRHDAGVKRGKSLLTGVGSINPKDRNGLKSVGLFQANGKNPQQKIERLAASGGKMIGIYNTKDLSELEKQVIGFFGHMEAIGLGKNTERVVKNIIKHNLLEESINTSFQIIKTNHKNTRNAILYFIKNYGEEFEIHEMINEYKNNPSKELINKIMLNIVSSATRKYLDNPDDDNIKNIIIVLASGTQVGCTEIGKATAKNMLITNKMLSEQSSTIAYINPKISSSQ